MATEILAVGSANADSAEFTLSDTTLVFLKTAGGGAIPPNVRVQLLAKGSGGNKHVVIELNHRAPSVPLPAGTYIARRLKSFGSVGVERM